MVISCSPNASIIRAIPVLALASAVVQPLALPHSGIGGAGGIEALVDLGADQCGSASSPVTWSQTTVSR